MLSDGTGAPVPVLLATSMGHRTGSVSPGSQYAWVPSSAYGVCLSLISPPNSVFLRDIDKVLNVPGGRVSTRTQGSACSPSPQEKLDIYAPLSLWLCTHREKETLR